VLFVAWFSKPSRGLYGRAWLKIVKLAFQLSSLYLQCAPPFQGVHERVYVNNRLLERLINALSYLFVRAEKNLLFCIRRALKAGRFFPARFSLGLREKWGEFFDPHRSSEPTARGKSSILQNLIFRDMLFRRSNLLRRQLGSFFFFSFFFIFLFLF